MDKYYIPMTQPISMLTNNAFTQFKVNMDAFISGTQLLYTNKDLAMQCASIHAGTMDMLFIASTPLIPAVTMYASLDETGFDKTLPAISIEELRKAKLPYSEDSPTYCGKYDLDALISLTARFDKDILHEEQDVVCENDFPSRVIDISKISIAAQQRTQALGKLSDVLYITPKDKREELVKKLEAENKSQTFGKEYHALRMVLSTDVFHPTTMPSISALINNTMPSLAEMKGFVHTNPAGFDFGIRLLQATEKNVIK